MGNAGDKTLRARGRAAKRFAAMAAAGMFVLSLLPGLVGGQNALKCPGDMMPVPGGKFKKGTDPELLGYIIELCRETFDNCSTDWFAHEAPRKVYELEPYCIDRYEYPNQKGRVPAYAVSWDVANKLCISQGKRLCAEKEWEKACAGPSGSAWPFGFTYNENACNNYNTGAIEPSGRHTKCSSPYGVYDMSGNLAEWTASTLTTDFTPATGKTMPRLVKGGSYKDHPIYTRCAFRDSYDPDRAVSTIGFRCCWPIIANNPTVKQSMKKSIQK